MLEAALVPVKVAAMDPAALGPDPQKWCLAKHIGAAGEAGACADGACADGEGGRPSEVSWPAVVVVTLPEVMALAPVRSGFGCWSRLVEEGLDVRHRVFGAEEGGIGDRRRT